jgi:hypothetical protein
MINKINKERRHSMNSAPIRASNKEPRRTPNKNRTGHKAEHGILQIRRQKTNLKSRPHILRVIQQHSSEE